MHKIKHFALVLAGALLFAGLFPVGARAQFTTVTATVTDPNGIPYAGGTMSAVLVPGAPGGFRLSGQPYSGRVGPATLDSTGTFTANFGDVTLITPSAQWQITIDSNPGGIEPPLGTGGQTFTYTSTGTIISGSSPVNISTQLNALAPKLTNFGGGSSLISGSVTPTHLTFATAVDTIGDVSGSAVTAGTGAIALTASADTVTPLNVFGHSATQFTPVAMFSSGGVTNNCIGLFSTFCVNSANGVLGIQVVGTTSDSAQIRLLSEDSPLSLGGLGASMSYGNYSLLISGQGSDGLSAYITMGDDFAPQQSNVSIYSELWTYFGFNGNLSWKDGINSQTGDIRAGWLPDKVGQVAQHGSFSIVDGGLAHEAFITNPGTMAANYNFAMPITAGTTGQPLLSQGGGTTPMIWGSISGTGSFCLTTSCVMTTPNLGTPSAVNLTNATGFPAAVVQTGQTNVYGAFLQDFTSATMEIPEAAGFTASVNSTIGLDTTANITHLWTNNADSSVCAATATDTATTHAMFATAVAGICNTRAIAAADIATALASPGAIGGTTPGAGTFTTLKGTTLNTATNCSSSASPAVCGSAASGSVALPTGTNPTLQVNTSAVTANSQIMLTVDESLGTKLSVTCNTTLSTLLNPVVTARTGSTSFTFTIGAVIASNPACVSYTIIN